MSSKARNLSDFISDPAIDSTELGSGSVTTDKLSDQAVTPAKLHNTLDLSSKTVTLANDGISGNSVHGGVISSFASTGIDDNASAIAITIDSINNVTIGASPVGGSAKLDILPSGTYGVWIRSQSDDPIGLEFGYQPNHGSYRSAVRGFSENYGGSDAGSLAFYTSDTYNTGSLPERMRIRGNGNVGIGTPGPSYKLDVFNSSTDGGSQMRVKNTYASINAHATVNIDGYGSSTLKLWRNGVEEWKLERLVNTDDLQLNAYGGAVSGGAGAGVVQHWDYDTGNVGIGTTTPLDKLHVSTSDSNLHSTTLINGTNTKGLWLTNTNNNNDMMGVHMATGNGTHFASIMGARTNNGAHWGTHLSFYTHSDDTDGLNTAAEKVRITGNGQLCVGATEPVSATRIYALGSSVVVSAEGTGSGFTEGSYLGISPNSYRGGGLFMYNKQGGGTPDEWFVGRLYTDASTFNVSYLNNPTYGPGQDTAQFAYRKFTIYQNGNYYFTGSNVSDVRIKQDIKDSPSQLENVLALRPKTFKIKPQTDENNVAIGEPSETRHGLIAQEVLLVLPHLVTGDESDETQMMGVDYLGLTSILVKAMQEQQEIIELLKSRLDAAGL
jgi:trimeric autotransporter adhesin